MNTLSKKLNYLLFFIFSILTLMSVQAQVGGWNPELKKEANGALEEIKKEYPAIDTYVNKSYGYVVFPKVTKAGFGIGGASGKGIVWKGNTMTGEAKLSQGSIGLQAGGQQYSEVIFFENQAAYDNFTNGKLKFDGQASAVALKKGASIDAAYNGGVAVFTKVIGGLMFEASLGGQQFKFKPKS